MNFFNSTGVRKIFGYVPTLKGSQSTALSNVTNHFTGISTIMAEGKVLPDYIEFANQKIYEAKLAVDAAIAYGWNNGTPTDY